LGPVFGGGGNGANECEDGHSWAEHGVRIWRKSVGARGVMFALIIGS
jgi:hypothetical protein